MNLVDQVVSAVEASAKVVWSVFFASLTVIAVELYFPSLFVGLPTWVMPVLRIVSIFTLVLSVASLTVATLGFFSKAGAFIVRPFNVRSIKRKLLKLGISEVYVLSLSLAKSDRNIRMNPDQAVAISLEDKGLIRPYWSGVILGDGLSSFEVPQDVWRVLLSMEEFRIPNPPALIVAQSEGGNEAKIRAALPPRHPSVLSQ